METVQPIELKTRTEVRVLVPETLLSIPKGEARFIHCRQIKPELLRNEASKLRKEGYEFKPSTRGIPDGTIVERIK